MFLYSYANCIGIMELFSLGLMSKFIPDAIFILFGSKYVPILSVAKNAFQYCANVGK